MSVLDEVLREEYERIKKIRAVMQAELNELPKEYISRKNIRGNIEYYLQKRVGAKLVSSYISKEAVPGFEKKIARRKQLQASIRGLDKNIRKIERVIR
jgi:hypothetical protein